MPLDLNSFSNKILRYRNQFDLSISDVSTVTGIPVDRLTGLENGELIPSGDEVLIIADFYKCDFNFFISNEKHTALEKTELLFRRYNEELSTNDRWAIQECIYFAECEKFLDEQYNQKNPYKFEFNPIGRMYKQHGIGAAKNLREKLYYRANEFSLDIYNDLRKVGFKIYRRKLESNSISGVCIKYDDIGKILLVNYDEDIYRQRFTVAHEVGHAIFDNEDGDVSISFVGKWGANDLREIRANNFAANFIMPPELLNSIPDKEKWDGQKIIEWANKIKVSTTALIIALKNNRIIDNTQVKYLKSFKVPAELKVDPELVGLSPSMKERKEILLERGLTTTYINKCIKAQHDNIISINRMFEMLLVGSDEEKDINNVFKIGLEHRAY